MTLSVADAARNNAALCSAVSEREGSGSGSFAGDAWSTTCRTPPLYPDAVTLAPGADPRDIVRRIEPGEGCSVKDSFADLDLAPFGFTVLFDAEWITRPTAPVGRAVVRAQAPPALHVVEGDGWSVRFNRSDGCVGLSNVTTDDGASVDDTWDAAIAATTAWYPGLPIVGYESGDDLATARRHRFTVIGPLRIWIS